MMALKGTSGRTWCAAGATVLAAVLSGTGLAGDELSEAHPHRERETQPPAERAARSDPAARSAPFRVTVGPYTSVQVNVDGAELNIVGDAANEPSIAVDPTDSGRMIIGWRQFDSIASNFRQAGYAFTVDGGASWTFPGVLTPGTFRSDPVIEFDAQGNAYYQSLKSDFSLDVFKSADAGQSWGAPVFAFGGDKNWMAVDRSGGAGDGNLYGIWQRAAGCCGPSIFNRSETGGVSFEPPVPVAGSPGLGTLAVSRQGDVFAAGIDETVGQDLGTIVAARSGNADQPGSMPAFNMSEVGFDAAVAFGTGPNPGGLLGQVNVAVDTSDGPSAGIVYVLASLDRDAPGTNPLDVLISRSTNGGASWSAPVRVNDDAPNGGAWHWFGALSVAPNGRLDAIWNDTRNSGVASISELFYSWSWDQGATWSPNVPVSPPFNSHVGWPSQNKIGDYCTIVSDRTGASAAYSATFNGEQDVYYIRLFPDCNGNGQSDVLDVEGPSNDCNLNLVPDECEPTASCLGAGATPSRHTSGQPLLLDKTAGGSLALSWGASCFAADTDYAVYEGVLGDFSSHVPRACSTDAATQIELVPAAANRYYLVVPRNPTREGSYGRTSAAAERPASSEPCLPQEIAACFQLP